MDVPSDVMLRWKTVLSTMQNDLLHEFTDKKFVSFCNRFWSSVAATAGHWHCEQSVFTARGYAKRGICRRRVSVCVCVCHTFCNGNCGLTKILHFTEARAVSCDKQFAADGLLLIACTCTALMLGLSSIGSTCHRMCCKLGCITYRHQVD